MDIEDFVAARNHMAENMNHEPNIYGAEGDTRKGTAVYTPLALALYDLAVLGFSNSFIWQCASHVLLDFYNQHISVQHLDIGVGTGYFLDRCRFPSTALKIALFDLTLTASQNQPSACVATIRPAVWATLFSASISACLDLIPSRSTISRTASLVIWRARASCLRT